MSDGNVTTASPEPAADRNRRRTEVGTVTSDKRAKTRTVVVERLVPHGKYGKYIKRRTVCHAHDEANSTREGDIVEIMETRPLSKQKRWRVTRVVRAAARVAGE